MPESPSEKKEKPEKACPNCGRKLKPKFTYCPDCGQKNVDRKVSLGILLQDYVREELHFNNKTLRSLKLFLLQPGSLTQAYMQGQRKNWVTPTKLFFWTGFFFLGALLLNIDLREKAVNPVGPIIKVGGFENLQISFKDPKSESAFARFLKKQLNGARDNPDEFIHKSIQKLPFVLLFILPFFALVLKLFFWKKHLLFLEHLVFLLHFHAFAFLLLGLVLLTNFLPGNSFWLIIKRILEFGLFGYFLISLKRVYSLGWGGTIGKGVAITFVYLIVVPTTLILLTLLAGLVAG